LGTSARGHRVLQGTIAVSWENQIVANSLTIKDAPEVVPSAEEVVIDVHACGINFADIMAFKGLYPDAPPFPCVVGYEVSGVISKVGANVDASWVGKRVIAMTLFGGYSEQVATNMKHVFEIPEGLDFVEAAAIPVVYLTAYTMLVRQGGLKSDETLLIQNAGSGVGLAAIDIAKHIGATTIGSASGRKHEFLQARGLTHPIDYTKKDVKTEVFALTDNKGVDLVIDPLGVTSWKDDYAMLRPTGRMIMFGVSDLTSHRFGKIIAFLLMLWNMPTYKPFALMNDNRGVMGCNMGHLFCEVDRLKGWLQSILDGVKEGWVHPFVDSVFAFENVAEAHQHILDRKSKGKVILTTKNYKKL